LHVNAFARGDRLASSPDDWRASCGTVALVAVTGWIPVRRVLTKAVIRLENRSGSRLSTLPVLAAVCRRIRHRIRSALHRGESRSLRPRTPRHAADCRPTAGHIRRRGSDSETGVRRARRLRRATPGAAWRISRIRRCLSGIRRRRRPRTARCGEIRSRRGRRCVLPRGVYAGRPAHADRRPWSTVRQLRRMKGSRVHAGPVGRRCAGHTRRVHTAVLGSVRTGMLRCDVGRLPFGSYRGSHHCLAGGPWSLSWHVAWSDPSSFLPLWFSRLRQQRCPQASAFSRSLGRPRA
jgi:hypothetical protein